MAAGPPAAIFVRSCSPSDMPPCACGGLSGGTWLAMMAKHMPRRIRRR